jgi:hypothetical protein
MKIIVATTTLSFRGPLFGPKNLCNYLLSLASSDKPQGCFAALSMTAFTSVG